MQQGYVSPVAAFIELSLDCQKNFLVFSRKDSKETGRFLKAKEAVEKLKSGDIVTCATGLDKTICKTYVPHKDVGVYIFEQRPN